MTRPRPAATRAGVVSVVVVNYRGAPETVECLRSLDEVAWPSDRLQVIVVDNASGDGSAQRIRDAVPRAQVVESEVNLGFAGGCNLAGRRASGEYLAILNNDARPDVGWIAAAVAAFEHHPSVGAVASKVLDWEGRTVDFVDASMTWFGMGYKREVGRPETGAEDEPRDVLFATGAAMFVRADAWHAAGGFDDRYFMFYEDVDLGWRLNLLGHRVRYVPSSVAYHRHHASMKGYGSWREHYLLERNALFTLYKNYGDELLARVLPGALALAVRRGVARGSDDPRALDLAVAAPPADEPATIEVSRETLAGAYAVHDFVGKLPELHADRRRIQAARRRGDAELLPLFRDPLEPAFADSGFVAAYRAVTEAFAIPDAFGSRRRVVVATEEPLTGEMAGPAIRAWAIAVALSAEHEVELVTLRDCTLAHARFRCRSVTEDELRALDEWCDVWVVGGLLMWVCRWLESTDKVLVVDVYDPFHLEQLEQTKDGADADRVAVVDECTAALNAELERGDFFLCASTRQRDFWLGQLAAVGRVNPQTYDDDPTLASLIAVVPFGLPEDPPVHERPAIRGVVAGVGADDEVLLWGGGIYNWLDPLTLLRAVDRLRHRRPRVRLVFLGLRHPNPAVPRMRMATDAEKLSSALGLTGTHVFFNHDWVPYSERQNHLLEADVGVTTHLEHVETAFSFRTRVLDYLWASLPVVATEGDALAELVASRGAGLTVPGGDVDALEDALFRLLDDADLRKRCRVGAAAVASELTWPVALRPLLEFCRSPRRAPDRIRPAPVWFNRVPRSSDLASDLALARTYLRQGGSRELARRAYGRVRRTVLARRSE
ncbi:MAG TPA: glycosyltransferase [Acidimicrobiales bacterium]|nr:glycosyltransferase [Acidimicrobiales bacterium]